MPKQSISIFSWGYWGWGTSTNELVRMVDAVERSRGYGPPLFVDIRYSRSVCAEGFRERAFEQLVGGERYEWMRSLGNRAIGTRDQGMVINDPAGAAELVDLAVRSAAEGRRVIFFCACESIRVEGQSNCHRDLVGSLLIEAAEARGVAAEVVEWPGGTLSNVKLEASAEDVRAVFRGRYTLPFGEKLALAMAGAIAHGSELTVRSPAGDLVALTGPAKYTRNEWLLPLHTWWSLPLSEHEEAVDIESAAKELRINQGFEPRRTT